MYISEWCWNENDFVNYEYSLIKIYRQQQLSWTRELTFTGKINSSLIMCTLISLAYTVWGLTDLKVRRALSGFYLSNSSSVHKESWRTRVYNCIIPQLCSLAFAIWARYRAGLVMITPPTRPKLGNHLWHFCFASIVQFERFHVGFWGCFVLFSGVANPPHNHASCPKSCEVRWSPLHLSQNPSWILSCQS